MKTEAPLWFYLNLRKPLKLFGAFGSKKSSFIEFIEKKASVKNVWKIKFKKTLEFEVILVFKKSIETKKVLKEYLKQIFNVVKLLIWIASSLYFFLTSQRKIPLKHVLIVVASIHIRFFLSSTSWIFSLIDFTQFFPVSVYKFKMSDVVIITFNVIVLFLFCFRVDCSSEYLAF